MTVTTIMMSWLAFLKTRRSGSVQKMSHSEGRLFLKPTHIVDAPAGMFQRNRSHLQVVPDYQTEWRYQALHSQRAQLRPDHRLELRYRLLWLQLSTVYTILRGKFDPLPDNFGGHL